MVIIWTRNLDVRHARALADQVGALLNAPDLTYAAFDGRRFNIHSVISASVEEVEAILSPLAQHIERIEATR